MNAPKYLKCAHCGNMLAMVKDSGVPVVCCGDEMKVLVPGTTDASLEKHVPVISIDGNTVTVAVVSVAHPMVPEHYIEWIALVTEQGYQHKYLKPARTPSPSSRLPKATGHRAYEYATSTASGKRTPNRSCRVRALLFN